MNKGSLCSSIYNLYFHFILINYMTEPNEWGETTCNATHKTYALARIPVAT